MSQKSLSSEPEVRPGLYHICEHGGGYSISVSNIRDKKFQLMISKSVLISQFGLVIAQSKYMESNIFYPL